jgi:hypothetical protein
MDKLLDFVLKRQWKRITVKIFGNKIIGLLSVLNYDKIEMEDIISERSNYNNCG